MRKTLAVILCLALLMSVVPTLAEETAAPVAYIMYADGAWANQFWYDGNEYPVKATTAESPARAPTPWAWNSTRKPRAWPSQRWAS
ncbi:MAG: hypothetical protein IKH30_05590 [Clostridia bacterium]|nr:hypothetical protein [Clostridia bacterium]